MRRSRTLHGAVERKRKKRGKIGNANMMRDWVPNGAISQAAPQKQKIKI
jgi:hypothetical protein